MAVVTEPNKGLQNQIAESFIKINSAQDVPMRNYGIGIQCIPEVSDGNHFE